MKSETGPEKTVGYFEDKGQTIFIVPEASETDTDAMARVAKAHNVDPAIVKPGRPPLALNPVSELVADLASAASKGDKDRALVMAKAIVTELEGTDSRKAPAPGTEEAMLTESLNHPSRLKGYLARLSGSETKATQPSGNAFGAKA